MTTALQNYQARMQPGEGRHDPRRPVRGAALPRQYQQSRTAGLYLYRDWLPASGEEARDFPMYCKRWLSLIPEVSAHEVVAELFLPLK